nr:MAG TPA_asm: hypothetical protein [Caudoviricetes sp.]
MAVRRGSLALCSFVAIASAFICLPALRCRSMPDWNATAPVGRGRVVFRYRSTVHRLRSTRRVLRKMITGISMSLFREG